MRDRDYITETPSRADGRRFWCAYTDLEEYHAGMWRRVCSEADQLDLIAQAVGLLGSAHKFTAAVDRVLAEWPTSCRAEFTSPGHHLAWLGQAACCLARRVPEELTRRAWWKLTETQRDTANRIAESAVTRWKAANHNVSKSTQLDLFALTAANDNRRDRYAQAIS